MKIVLFCICVFCICASLLAGTNTSYLSADDVMQGFTLFSNNGRDVHQKWLRDLYEKRTMLTNDVERIKLTKELVQILNSVESSNQDKCAAAFLIGIFQLNDGIKALINNFMLGNDEALAPDSIKLAEGEMPAGRALVLIGEPAIPEVVGFIESSTNSYQLKLVSGVILYVKGQEEGAEFLKQAIADQTDTKKKENLKVALASEYFTDPKYQASGPQKQKAILEARVTLQPETLNVNPGILTAFVRLPDGYPVSGIISATCDGAPAERMMPNEDGTEMIIKFRRKDIEAALAQTGESLDINFVVRGTWHDAERIYLFQGADSITKIVGAKEKKK